MVLPKTPVLTRDCCCCLQWLSRWCAPAALGPAAGGDGGGGGFVPQLLAEDAAHVHLREACAPDCAPPLLPPPPPHAAGNVVPTDGVGPRPRRRRVLARGWCGTRSVSAFLEGAGYEASPRHITNRTTHSSSPRRRRGESFLVRSAFLVACALESEHTHTTTATQATTR